MPSWSKYRRDAKEERRRGGQKIGPYLWVERLTDQEVDWLSSHNWEPEVYRSLVSQGERDWAQSGERFFSIKIVNPDPERIPPNWDGPTVRRVWVDRKFPHLANQSGNPGAGYGYRLLCLTQEGQLLELNQYERCTVMPLD